MTRLAAIRHETVREALSDALRLTVGHGRRYGYAQLADAAGISESSLKSYARGEAVPGLDQFLRLAAVLGPSFGSSVTAVAGLELREAEPDPVSWFAAHADAAQLTAAFAEALRDGRFDHREKAALKPMLIEVRAAISGLLAGMG